jgi:sortase B
MGKRSGNAVVGAVLVAAALVTGHACQGWWDGQISANAYADLAKGVVTTAEAVSNTTAEAFGVAVAQALTPEETVQEQTPPIQVDFDLLRQTNADVVGWLYCSGTSISYPVVQCSNNDYYLNHLYTGEENSSGAIFVDCNDQKDFADANTLIYGAAGSGSAVFAGLEDFSDQSYYQAHPVMWLLTPEQNYQVVLLAGYDTTWDSDTYTIFSLPGDELSTYLRQRLLQSDFQAGSVPHGSKYVVLSTYSNDRNAQRYVLHGVLLPVDD